MAAKPEVVDLLDRPLLLDRHGCAYVLTSDGTARAVPGFDPGTAEKALNFHRGAVSWLCSDKNLTLSFRRSGHWGQKPLGPMPLLGMLPDYPLAFGVHGPAHDWVVINGRDRIFGVEIDARGNINERVLDARFLAFTGWSRPERFCLAGMLPRVEVQGEIHKWGTAAILSMQDQVMQVEELDAQAAIREIAPGVERELRHALKIEACLGAATVGSDIWCVAGVIFDTFDADTDWFHSGKPGYGDYTHLVLLQLGAGGTRLVEDLPRYSYVTHAETDRVHYFYLRPVANDLALRAMQVDKASGAQRTVEVTIEGLPTSSKPLYFRCWHDSQAGFYGCFGIYTATGYQYFLVTSDDGAYWRCKQELRHYPR